MRAEGRRLRRRQRSTCSSSSASPSPSRRLPFLLPRPPRAIGFDLLGGGGRNNDDGDDESPLVPGSRSPSSSASGASSSPRDLLLASGRLILLRDLFAADSSSDAVAPAALSLLRAVASPGGRNDGAASSAGAALAAALASRPAAASSSSNGSIGGWRGFLLDEVVVGRNNPLARSVARGAGSEAEEEDAAASASAAGAALAADLSALQLLASFDGATAASWVRGSDPSVPRAWLDALSAAVDGGREQRQDERTEEVSLPLPPPSPPPPSPRLLPPLTRAQRSAAASSLASRARWADGAPELISLWSRHGSGNVGSYFAFEWNPNSPTFVTPSAEDKGGGAVSLPLGGSEKFGGAAATLWDPVASRLAAWARGDRLAPFDGGEFAARLEVPPSSLVGVSRESGGDGDDDDDDEKKRKKEEKKNKKKEGEEGANSSSSTSPSPSLSLWDGLRTSPVLLASGARIVRLPASNSKDSSASNLQQLRALWRALRLHPRCRWVVVSDSFPSTGSGGGGEAGMAMEGELPPGVALAVRKR